MRRFGGGVPHIDEKEHFHLTQGCPEKFDGSPCKWGALSNDLGAHSGPLNLMII
ncbi:hypothetical protein Sjap_008684 [Stephania japonica]|uniref:Uncharacterized protein n=1 Tax=Stephania japonica TaxID=461633 RepID=A0AAP0JS97_9MAGN